MPKQIDHDVVRHWVWVVIFAIAFAWIESAVVVYLRELYFDGGFYFPLDIRWSGGEHLVDPLVRIEFGREIATILVLIAAGSLAGRNRFHRFCFFLIAFGVWDIWYYIWLVVMVNWPPGLMTWDLLFYVPLPWVGPVITPVLIAAAMVAAGTSILYFEARGHSIAWRWYDVLIEAGCGLLMIVAFCWDWKNILQVPGNPDHTGIPNPFAWWLYLPAYLFSIAYFTLRLKRLVSKGPRTV